MRRLMSVVLGVGLLLGGIAFAEKEQIIQQLTANGSRTTRPFTVKDGWEVRWTADKDLSVYLLDAHGQPLQALGHSMGERGGATYHAKGGTYCLKILSNALNWTVSVIQLP